MKNVCILGGGASALMCACCAKDNVNVKIIEQNSKVGKKILATGNGRCNLTNKIVNDKSYNTDIKNFLNKFNQFDTLNFFNSIGLETYADNEGRVYPFSNSASSVLEVLLNYLINKKNINIDTDKKFVDIEKIDNKYRIQFEDSFEDFDEVIVALGNKANLNLFEKFGVKNNPFVPSLCGLKTSKNKNLAGTRVSNVKVFCKAVNFEETGEILFREDGISGIVIFNLSAFLSRAKINSAEIIIDLMPNINFEILLNKLKNRKELLKNYKINDFLTGFFNKTINFDLINKLKFDLEKDVSKLSDKDLFNLAKLIKNYSIKTLGFLDNNQVFNGGVKLSSLTNCLEAINQKGLYFIGEIVDVDGVCGGYNLQWAWTSGKIVGENL